VRFRRSAQGAGGGETGDVDGRQDHEAEGTTSLMPLSATINRLCVSSHGKGSAKRRDTFLQ
jgi:hypothetical protein